MLRHWHYLFWAAHWLLFTFGRAAWYFKKNALRDLALPQPDALTSKEKRRLKHYFYGTTYLAVIFCTLRGKPRNARERRLFFNLSALAYFFDDLAEVFQTQDQSGRVWHDNPEHYGSVADERGLALHFLRNIYAELPPEHVPEFKEFMHRVFNIETAGRQQSVHKSLTLSDLCRITAEKGAYSVLLFRRVLAHDLDDRERDALYQMGYLIQLCDDIFDVWFDHQAGIQTPALQMLTRGEVSQLAQLFEVQVATTAAAFQATTFSTFHKNTASRGVHFLVGITRVCLVHYAEVQKKMGHFPLQDRQMMVVDMEKWPNRVKAARAVLTPPPASTP